jgi:hypothetical protein
LLIVCDVQEARHPKRGQQGELKAARKHPL